MIKKFDLLVSIYIFCICVSELMGAKTFPIGNVLGFKLSSSVAIFVLPFIFTINDVVTEVFGKERTRSLIRSSLVVVFLIMVVSIFFTSLPSTARFSSSEKAYDDIFGKSARIAFASLTAFALAEFTDVLVFVKIRQKLGKKALWLRNNVSNFVGQFMDTAIFISLAFYAFNKPFGDNFTFLLGLIIPYWLIKSFVSVLETPFVYWGVSWLSSGKEK